MGAEIIRVVGIEGNGELLVCKVPTYLQGRGDCSFVGCDVHAEDPLKNVRLVSMCGLVLPPSNENGSKLQAQTILKWRP